MLIWCAFHGRLGNNLFQYAAMVAAAARARRPVLLMDFSRLEAGATSRRLARLDFVRLGLPGVIFPPLLNRMVLKASGRLACECRLLPVLEDRDSPAVEQGLARSALLSGYFQHAALVERHAARLRETIWRRLSGFAQPPAGPESVAVHIRRGDYLNHPSRMVCGQEYFLCAMARLREALGHPRFHVFSDDPGWCRAHLSGADVEMVNSKGPGDALADLAAMAGCRHQIISNSSFSWWAGWLNPNPEKRVICPDRWTTDGSEKLDSKLFPGCIPLRSATG